MYAGVNVNSTAYLRVFDWVFDLLLIWLLIYSPSGRPNGGSVEWVDRHGCRESRDGPWMARGGVPTEQDRSEGHLSAAKAVR